MAGDSRGPPLLLPPTSLDSEAFCNFIDHGCGAESHGVSPPSWCAVQAALAKRRHEDHRRLFIPRLTRWVKKTVSTHQLPTSARVSSSMYLQITTAPPRPAVNHAAELPWLTDNRSTVSGSSSPTAHLLQTIKEPSQPQCQSAFFRLPLEVRLQVYDCLLFGRYILMLLSYGPLPGHNSDTWYLWHTSSAIADSSDISHLDVFRRQIDAAVIPEREDYQRRLEFNKRVRERTEKLQVAITRTCRQAYFDTAGLIYSRNTIVLSNDLLARHMDRFFLPWQLSSLTSLDLVWTLQHSHQPLASGKAKQSYNELWESLAFAPLPSLRRLRVHIDPTHDNRYPGFDVSTFTEAWLGPVFAYASRSTIDHFEFGIPDTYLRHFDEHSISQRTFVLRRLKSQNLRRLERGLERGSMCCCDADTARDRLRQCHFIHQAFPPGEPIHPVHCKGCLPEDQPVPRDRDQVDCRLMD